MEFLVPLLKALNHVKDKMRISLIFSVLQFIPLPYYLLFDIDRYKQRSELNFNS